jgi:hypothetical protein
MLLLGTGFWDMQVRNARHLLEDSLSSELENLALASGALSREELPVGKKEAEERDQDEYCG